MARTLAYHARGMMAIVHLVVTLHGIAPSSTQEASSSHRVIREFHAALARCLAESFQPILIHWGHATKGKSYPESRLSAAEAFLQRATDVDFFRQRADRGAIPGATWLIRKRLGSPFRQLLMEGLGDLVYYASPEGERALRRALYQQLFSAWPFKGGSLGREPISLSVIAHSAGAILAFDLLYELFCPTRKLRGGRPPSIIRDKRSWGDTSRQLRLARRQVAAGAVTLRAFVTLGSFLPLFFLRRQLLVDQLSRGRKLDPAVIGLRGQGRWLNVWDYDDLVAFPIAGLFRDPEKRIRDLQVDTGDWISSAHTGYWRHPEVIAAIAHLISKQR